IEELRNDVGGIDLFAGAFIAAVGHAGFHVDEIALFDVPFDPFRLLLVQDRDLNPVGGTFALSVRLPLAIGRHIHLQHALQRHDVSDVTKQGMPVNRTHGLNLS
ncbi:conserved hypothetical protein, partial [Ricinus communis]